LIFSDEECEIIATIKQRKMVEQTVYRTLESLPVTLRTSMESQLDLDIKRCDAF